MCERLTDHHGHTLNDGDSINLQHYLMTELLGYLLHPDIPLQNANLKIADIAAGTGWVLILRLSELLSGWPVY